MLGLDPDTTLPDELTMAFILDNKLAMFMPMMIGGLLMAIVAWCGSFWLVRRAVTRYQLIRLSRIRRRAERMAKAQINADAMDDEIRRETDGE